VEQVVLRNLTALQHHKLVLQEDLEVVVQQVLQVEGRQVLYPFHKQQV
jgi:hypothetical protein